MCHRRVISLRVREICTRAGVLLVFDEIQTGLGRTGAMFCCDLAGVRPDVMTLAKALGGGLMPIGAVLCSEDAYTESFALKHSSTFAGNTLACRAGSHRSESVDSRPGISDAARGLYGARLKRRLRELQRTYPQLIAEVRGRGLLLANPLRAGSRPLARKFFGRGSRAGIFYAAVCQLFA